MAGGLGARTCAIGPSSSFSTVGSCAGSRTGRRLVVACAGRPRKCASGVEHHRDGDDGKPELPAKFGLKWLETGGELTGLKMEELVRGGHGVLFGARIPKHYFMVKGFGETDQGDGADPWETGSYDLALEDAGIQDLNIIQYTSVIPPEAEPITMKEAKPFLRHGAVQESIMAKMNGVKGDRITAGVGRVQIRRKKDKFHIGGYAAEYEGHATGDVAQDILKKDLNGLFRRRYDEDEYECFEEDFTIIEENVTKNFGSVLASICFVTYVTPTYTRSQYHEILEGMWATAHLLQGAATARRFLAYTGSQKRLRVWMSRSMSDELLRLHDKKEMKQE